MIAELVKAGYLKETVTEGRKTFILKTPMQVVLKANVLQRLQKAYPPHEETGGILYAYPVAGSLIISQFSVLPNQLVGDARKTAYQPAGSAIEINQALELGALPIRFHSHPVEIYENPYDNQPLTFFQKTSNADRHNSYIPITVDQQLLVLPNGLLSANDRAGTDIRFYLYGGLVTPDSLQALLSNERVYVYFSLALVLLFYLLKGFKKSVGVFALAAVLSVAVFAIEKRPTATKNADGDLIISIP